MKRTVFIGRVNSLRDDRAWVSLITPDGEVLDSMCEREPLDRVGVVEGEEFRCEIVKGQVVLERLRPVEVPPERVAELRAQFRGKWLL